MSKKPSTPAMYVTADEAVARLTNLQMLPTGVSLLEMTSAFLEQAGSDIASIPDDEKPGPAFAALKRKYLVSHHRHELAKTLMEGIRTELISTKPRILSKKDSFIAMLDWHSVRAWAYDEFEISVAVETGPIAEFEVEGDHPKYSEKLRGLIGPKGYSQIKTASLLASFYVLLFDFARRTPKQFLKHGGKLSPDPLAEELSKLSSMSHPYFKSFAQSQSNWKLQIQTANEVLISAEEYVPPKR